MCVKIEINLSIVKNRIFVEYLLIQKKKENGRPDMAWEELCPRPSRPKYVEKM